MGVFLTPEQEAAIAAGAKVEKTAPVQIGARVAGAAPILYDAATGEAQPGLDSESASKALLAGTSSVLPDATVNVIGPDGTRGSVKGTELVGALQRGYRVEGEKEARTADYLEQNRGLKGDIKVGASKLASEAAFGVPEIAYEHTASRQDVEDWEALKAEHQAASIAGSGLGFGASLLVGGPLFKGATAAGKAAEAGVLAGRTAETAGIGRAILGTTARMGAEGAVLAAPQAITEAALGDPKAAAEHLALGIGGGAALGAAVGTLMPGFRALGRGAEAMAKHVGYDAKAASPLENLSDKATVEALFHSEDARGRKELEQLGEKADLGSWLKERGLQKNIGEHFPEYNARIAQAKETAGKRIGAAYSELDGLGAKAGTVDELTARIEKEVIDPARRLASRAEDVRRLEGWVDDFKRTMALVQKDRGLAAEDAVALKDLWQQRSDLGKKIFNEGRIAARTGDMNRVEREFTQVMGLMDEQIEAGAKGVLGAERDFGKEIAELNRDYRRLSTVERVTDTAAIREEKNAKISLGDLVAGDAFSHVGAVHGSIPGMVLGAGAGLLRSYLRSNGAAIVSKYAGQVGTHFAHAALESGEKELAALPRLLAAAPSKEIAAQNGFHLFLGDKAANRSDEQNFKETSEKLSELAKNPAEQARHVAQVASVIAKGAPTVAAAYQQFEQNRANYLVQAMPKAPPPVPFQTEKWRPTPQQVRDFRDKLQIALKPDSVVRELRRGTLTPAHVDALKAVWPARHAKMVQGIMVWGMSPEGQKTPYNRRLSLALMTGAPIDPALGDVGAYQQTFASEQAQRPAPSKLGKLPGSDYSQQQRMTA